MSGRPRSLAALLALALALAAPPRAAAQAAGDASSDPTEVVRRFVEAFDRHELEPLLALAHPDVEWLTVTGAELAVETRGRDALRASLASYFASCPTCRSTVDVYQVIGPYVSALEHAEWEKEGAKRRQSSLSVYEIVDGLVRRVWYFPAVPAPAEAAPAPG
jgi:hypothetical protein